MKKLKATQVTTVRSEQESNKTSRLVTKSFGKKKVTYGGFSLSK